MFCLCGCGKEPNKNRKYINGHQNIGRVHSEEVVRRQTESRRKNGVYERLAERMKNHPLMRIDSIKEKMIAYKTGKPSYKKGKTYEEIYGKEKSIVILKNLSESHKGIIQKESTRKKRSTSMSGSKNPMFGVPCPWKEWDKNPLKKYHENMNLNPDLHPNRIMAKKGFISKPQLKLFEIIRQHFPDAELEFPIRTQHGLRFADIGVPSLKMDFEYNGAYWHKDHEDSDTRRKFEIEESGWNVVTVTEEEMKKL